MEYKVGDTVVFIEDDVKDLAGTIGVVTYVPNSLNNDLRISIEIKTPNYKTSQSTKPDVVQPINLSALEKLIYNIRD